MLKKLIVATLTSVCSISFCLTNKEIIKENSVKNREVFNKYFNGVNSSKSGKDENMLNEMYVEFVEWLENKNRILYNKELSGMESTKTGNKILFKSAMSDYNRYVNENSTFSKDFLMNFMKEKNEYQSYIYTTIYIMLESFNLNMNTALEGIKSETTVDDNVTDVINYLYSNTDAKSKEEYLSMSNQALKELLSEEFFKLGNIIEEKKLTAGKEGRKKIESIKLSFDKMERQYNKYDKNFGKYVDSLNLKSENKEKIKKLVKFQKIANLKFLIDSQK